MTFAEKTLNMYQLTKEQSDQLMMNYVTSTYKRANRNINKQISTSEKSLLRDNKIIEQMETNEEVNSSITIKDHKENFNNHPTV